MKVTSTTTNKRIGYKPLVLKVVNRKVILKTKKGIKIKSLDKIKKSKEVVRNMKIFENICKDNYKIIQIKGNKKVNLLMLMYLREGRPAEIAKTIENQKKTSIQQFIWDIISDKNKRRNHMLWKAETLKILEHNQTLSIECNIEKNTFDCSLFTKQYDYMINSILKDKIEKVMIQTHPFYPEIDLYNDYVLSLDNLSVFNKKLLDREFSTINEKGVLFYIMRKLEENESNEQLFS